MSQSFDISSNTYMLGPGNIIKYQEKNVRGRVPPGLKLCLLEVFLDRDICRLRDPPPPPQMCPHGCPYGRLKKKIIQCPLGCPSSDTNVTKKCPLRDKYILTFWPLLPHRIQLVPFKLFHPMPLKDPESTSGFNYLHDHMIDLNRYLNIATILHE